MWYAIAVDVCLSDRTLGAKLLASQKQNPALSSGALAVPTGVEPVF